MQQSQKSNTHCFAVGYGPTQTGMLAVVGGANYGISGVGSLEILSLTPNGLQLQLRHVIQDSVMELSWRSVSAHLATACADGTAAVWAVNKKRPIALIRAHQSDATSIDWSKTNPTMFLTAGRDGSIHQWMANRSSLILTVLAHVSGVNRAKYSPHGFATLSCGADHRIKLFDWRNGAASVAIKSNAETLDVEFDKQDNQTIYAVSVDQMLRTWDLRSPKTSVADFKMDATMKTVKGSPHERGVVLCSGYDTRIFRVNIGTRDIQATQRHSEWVFGVDWSPVDRNIAASCSWDSTIKVGTINRFTC